MNASQALSTGDFRALLDGILSEDRVESTVTCPCGKPNTLIAVRTGGTVLVWTDAAINHGADTDDVIVQSFCDLNMARQAMDMVRAETVQLNGMAQLVAALGDETGVGIVVI